MLKQKFRFPGKPIRYRNSTKALLFPEGESSALFAFCEERGKNEKKSCKTTGFGIHVFGAGTGASVF
ncbi:MAG: hypothetical protein IKC08_02505, partial [Lentisphaeria bacterium]|nr:hypothetical protein [Lentisphaeria bacterium]